MPPEHHLYLHGFASSPLSKKALQVSRALSEYGIELDAPDLSLPCFEHLTLSAMLTEAERRLRATNVLWGSSLGAYIAMLLSARHTSQVKRLILMAPAIDFPTRYRERTAAAEPAWRQNQSVPVFHHALGREVPLARDLWEDCLRWPSSIGVSCPTLVFAARFDDVIPLEVIENWVRLQPRAELVVFDDSHELVETFPRALSRALEFVGLTPRALEIRQ